MSSDSQQTAITRADLDALKAEILGALNLLLRDPVRLSILTAPPDDEPYPEEQRRRDADAFDAIQRGEFTPHREVLREFDL